MRSGSALKAAPLRAYFSAASPNRLKSSRCCTLLNDLRDLDKPTIPPGNVAGLPGREVAAGVGDETCAGGCFVLGRVGTIGAAARGFTGVVLGRETFGVATLPGAGERVVAVGGGRVPPPARGRGGRGPNGTRGTRTARLAGMGVPGEDEDGAARGRGTSTRAPRTEGAEGREGAAVTAAAATATVPALGPPRGAGRDAGGGALDRDGARDMTGYLTPATRQIAAGFGRIMSARSLARISDISMSKSRLRSTSKVNSVRLTKTT